MTKEEELIQTTGIDVRTEHMEVAGYTLNYVVAGHGPVVIFLHGANIGWGQWYKTIAVCAASFTVVAVDLPGAGGSTKVDYTKIDIIAETLSVVGRFIEEIRQKFLVDTVALVGHSFGGWIALTLMQRHADTIRCSLVSNPIGFSDDMPRRQRLLGVYPLAWLLTKTVLRPHRENIYRFLSDACHDPGVLDTSFAEYVYEGMHRQQLSHPFLFVHALLSGTRLRKELLFQPQTIASVKPLCVIFGRHDPLVSHASHEPRCRTLLPKASVITYNTGHVPMLEDSDRFNKDLLAFLSQHSPACQYGVAH